MAQNRKRKKNRNKKPAKQHAKKRPTQLTFLRRIPSWGKVLITVFTVSTTVISLVFIFVQAKPWLTVDEGERLDPQNQYSSLFSVRNDGYLPVTNLEANCHIQPSVNSYGNYFDITDSTQQFAASLSYSQRATLPCFSMVSFGGSPPLPGFGDLTITVTYSVYPFSFRWLRKSQQFHFKAIPGKDNRMHWIYVT
jgi:hypothetical protein